MSFTDEDLKQIKQRGANKAAPWSTRLIELVARLEAAETIVDLVANGMDARHALVRAKWEAWRKAAGK